MLMLYIFWDMMLHTLVNTYLPVCSVLPKKIFSFLYHAKKDLEQKTLCIYNMLCTCDQVHNGQTGQIIEIGVEEQNWHICIGQLDQAAVAGHSLYIRHSIQTPEHQNHLHEILLHDHIIRNTTELHPNNANKEDGLFFSRAWKLLIHFQKDISKFKHYSSFQVHWQTVIHGTSCLKKLSSSFSTLFVSNLPS